MLELREYKNVEKKRNENTRRETAKSIGEQIKCRRCGAISQ
jgi:hypothetical protein